MGVPTAFKYNSNASYRTGGVYEPTHQFSLVHQTITIKPHKSFDARFPNIWSGYKLPKVKDPQIYQDWVSNPMQFFQNQVNFAVYIATGGCGVSKKNHLQHKNPMIRSVFRFHTYYQIRRVLNELQCPLPNEESFNTLNNPFNKNAFERICTEFGIPPKADFRQKLDPSQGLGVVRYYKTVKHYTHHGWTYTTEKVLEKGSDYDPKSKFTVYIPSSGKFASESVHHYKIEFIEQYFNGGSEMDAIGSFVLDESNGFTQPGISRINDSIRTFVWAILGAQGQARTSILGTGKAFDAQKQFLANVEDSVNSAVDLPSSIERYQSTLQYARSKVDFAVGLGLYMVPSDMDLHIGTVNGYNNLIVIASSDDNIQLGRNDAVNEQVIIPQETFESPPDDFEDSREHEDVHTPTEKDDTPAKKQDNSLTPVQEKLTHDENKLIMTLGGISIISSAIYFLK